MTDRPTKIFQLTSDLWVLQSRAMQFNAGTWINQGQALLIDPGVFADEVALLAATVKGQGAEPVALLLSHSHWDHILGPEHFPGVKVLAQEAFPKWAAHFEPHNLRRLEEWKGRGLQRQRPFVTPKPDEVFGETGEVRVGSLTLHLLHVPGHAADQLAVLDPQTGTLWSSDILSDTEIPFVSDNLAAYERTLARLAVMELRALAPGHGSTTSDSSAIRQRIAEDRAYLAELRRRVTRTVEAGQGVEAAVAACDSMTYRLKSEMTEEHRMNVESAYLELGGQPGDKPLGWARE